MVILKIPEKYIIKKWYGDIIADEIMGWVNKQLEMHGEWIFIDNKRGEILFQNPDTAMIFKIVWG